MMEYLLLKKRQESKDRMKALSGKFDGMFDEMEKIKEEIFKLEDRVKEIDATMSAMHPDV